MVITSVVMLTKEYVAKLFDQQLPPGMYFHNLAHTLSVFEAATSISLEEKVNASDMAVIQLAALFHDTGYLYQYQGHEEKSKIIAANYLMQSEVEFEIIERVVACIESTKIPQNPRNLQQQIICDADLAHLAESDYMIQAENLRREWQWHLNQVYGEKEWAQINLDFLNSHTYFTAYARRDLQPLKKNTGRLKDMDGLE